MWDNLSSRPTSLVGFMLGIVLGCLPTQTHLADETTKSDEDEVRTIVGVGGTSRFVTNRWGVAKATILNQGESPTSHLIVVTPQDSDGLQYARQIEVPARAMFDTVWPVRMANKPARGLSDFQYLYFPGGVDDGVIRHTPLDGQIPFFSGQTRNGPYGLTGWISDSRKGLRSDDAVQQMLRAMRFSKVGDQTLIAVSPRDITERVECLDPLDTLAVSDGQLNQFPHACEAIRLWVQRGGRLLLLLDSTGSEVARLLLGDCLPLTVVGETSTNEVQLDLNPAHQANQNQTRVVKREFDEPVRYIRVIPDEGETLWSVDNWPVAIRVPLGSGTVVVTTISPDVFIEQRPDRANETPAYAMIASSGRMQEALFNFRSVPIISQAAAAKQAAAMIGYEIPSKNSALLFLVLFPVSLVITGVLLQRRAGGERLIWALPLLAILTAIPAVAFGLRIRATAPATVIETTVIQSTPGQSRLASVGYATIYVPGPMDPGVSSTTGSKLDIPAEPTNRDYKRLIWSGPTDNAWKNLKLSTGLKTFPVEAIRRPESNWQAVATFDENGIRGNLVIDDPSAAAGLLLAGSGVDQMSLTLKPNGEFTGTVSDVLASGQYSDSTLISDEQGYRAALLASSFGNTDRLDPFPGAPSLLFWDERQNPALQIDDKTARRIQTVLVVQTLQLRPPAMGKQVTIPSPLLPYRSLASAGGSFSSAFNNAQKEWLLQESTGEILLEFQIPSVCVPLEPDSADLMIVIRAASRIVSVLSGSNGSLQQVAQFKSPLGTQSISIPAELIRESCLTGRVFLQINVSDLDDSMKSETMTGEQDDSWKIERVSLTLKGRRKPDN